MSESAVELALDGRNLRHCFRMQLALCDLPPQVKFRELAALICSSGSGKSTLLRMLTGVHCADLHGVSSLHLAGHHAAGPSHQTPTIRHNPRKESQPLRKHPRSCP